MLTYTSSRGEISFRRCQHQPNEVEIEELSRVEYISLTRETGRLLLLTSKTNWAYLIITLHTLNAKTGPLFCDVLTVTFSTHNKASSMVDL